jgi:CRISPR-associated protein Cmr6
MKYYVPSDTARVLASQESKCLNLRLILSRYLSEEVVANESVPNEKNQKWRDKWLKTMLSRFSKTENNKANAKLLANNLNAEVERWGMMTEDASRFQLWQPTRLIVGLGGKGALEVGITLHHVTGLPFIPGSALKGLARAYALLTLASENNIPNEDKALEKFNTELEEGKKDDSIANALHYRRAFGSQKEAGVCQFFDGVLYEWLSESLFTLDVMTPHFVQYYSKEGKEAPHDADSPNPVSFITVSEKNTWAFAVRLRHSVRYDTTNDALNAETLKMARTWLRKGLMEMGVGSKTSNGYGFFTPMPK